LRSPWNSPEIALKFNSAFPGIPVRKRLYNKHRFRKNYDQRCFYNLNGYELTGILGSK
jgi:hypothetical protein